MLCRFVFAFWWSVFVFGVWSRLNQPVHRWTVDRHKPDVIRIKQTLRPFRFRNVSVIWVDMLTDAVHLELERVLDAGTVSIGTATMMAFSDSFRDTVVETYPIQLQNTSVEHAFLDIVQDDVHLSPFRRIVIRPAMNWTLGSDDVPTSERPGRFKDNRWIEGRDATQLGAGVLFTWCMGVVFLVVMRHGDDNTVVVKRRKRIFKDTPQTQLQL
jgi:hypothetical protein